MVLLERRRDAAHHQDRLLLARLGDLHDLEAPRQRRILLDVLLVLGPGRRGDRAQRAARQRRLQQVGRIAGAGRAARADQRVRLVDEQDDRLRRRLHLVDHLAQPVLELALHAGAGLQQADVERAAACTSFSGGGTSPLAMRSAKPSTTAVLPTPASPVRIGLFCRRRIRMSTIWRISSSRPTTGSISPVARPLGEVDREALERLLLAHLRRRHRAARLARARPRDAVARAPSASSGEPLDDPREVVGQRVDLDLSRTAARSRSSALRSDGVFSMPTTRWPVRTCASPNISVRVDPAALDRVLDVRREVGDRRRAARQPVERLGDVLREPRRVELEVPDDAVQVGVLRLQDLLKPVHQLDVRIAAQLAEDGGALDRLVGQRC